MTASTIVTDRPSASSTSWMAPLMKVASSLVTRIFMPLGSVSWILAAAARTPVEMSSVFDCAARMMPSPMPVLPSERSDVALGSPPSVTEATSPSRVRPLMMMLSNASGVFTVAVARTTISMLPVVREPAGVSKATVSSALAMLAMVRPWLATLAWLTSTRKILSRSP